MPAPPTVDKTSGRRDLFRQRSPGAHRHRNSDQPSPGGRSGGGGGEEGVCEQGGAGERGLRAERIKM